MLGGCATRDEMQQSGGGGESVSAPLRQCFGIGCRRRSQSERVRVSWRRDVVVMGERDAPPASAVCSPPSPATKRDKPTTLQILNKVPFYRNVSGRLSFSDKSNKNKDGGNSQPVTVNGGGTTTPSPSIPNGGSNFSSISKKITSGFRRPHSIASTPAELDLDDDGGFESWKARGSCEGLSQLQEIIRRREAEVKAAVAAATAAARAARAANGSIVRNGTSSPVSLVSTPSPQPPFIRNQQAQRPTTLLPPSRIATNDMWMTSSASSSSLVAPPPSSCDSSESMDPITPAPVIKRSLSTSSDLDFASEYHNIISSFPLYTPPTGPLLSSSNGDVSATGHHPRQRLGSSSGMVSSATVPAGLASWSYRPQTVSTPVIQTPGQISRNPRPSHSQTWSQARRPHSVASPSDPGYRSLPSATSSELLNRRLSLPTPSHLLPTTGPKPSPTFHGLPFSSGSSHRPTRAASQALLLLLQSQRNGFNFMDDKVALLIDILDTQERFAQVQCT
ncbi:hypothetical protein LSTR_LSTR011402 [Laodelphax striatellus]|uniref:Uncharacterized protein n=1 Tax=Laodelphax striatellus TaxID=195883 RepID=A0A482WWB0_LAOST|nr:hypothetical protein LSTR_LSTR011402 [Laodelphax striatellus]